MSTDDFRLHYTYGIAILVLVGVFALVVMKIGEIPAEAMLSLATFVLGLALGFVFNREGTAGQARATERAMTIGAQTATPPPPTLNEVEGE